MSEYNRAELVKLLKANTLEVNFTKANGEAREMICTLKPDLLPTAKVNVESKSKRKVNEAVIPVFDLEAYDWRSFRVDAVYDVKVLN